MPPETNTPTADVAASGASNVPQDCKATQAASGGPVVLAPVRVRVRYADTDAMGVVYYANYLSFFEIGRVEAMRQVGAEYDGVVRRGIHVPVVEAAVQYRRPAAFDDVLLIATYAADLRGARFSFVYTITREADGALIASGRTVHACVESETLRLTRLPTWLRDQLQLLLEPA